MNKIVCYFIFMTLLLFSCNRQFTQFSTGEGGFIVKEFKFDYLTSKAKFRYIEGRKKTSAAANFRIKKDSIIWASISPGLGIELARVMISKEKIQMIDKLKKKYYEYDYKTLTETYGFEINYELIESIVLGNMLFLPEKRREVSKDDQHFIFTKKDGSYGVSHFIGVNSQKLEKLYAFDDVTNNSITVNYGRFEEVADQISPQSINVEMFFTDKKKDDTKIEIDYSRTILSTEPLKFPFNVSSRYTRK